MKVLAIICLLAGFACGMTDQEKFAHITQDTVELDLSSGEIHFNGELMEREQLSVRAKKAYSIELNAFDRSGASGSGLDDLFGDATESVNKGTQSIPVKWLVDVLEPIAATGLDPEMVRLELYMEPDFRKPATDQIRIKSGGLVVLNGEPVAIGDFSATMLRGSLVSIQSRERGSPLDFNHLLAVARALGSDVKITALASHDFSQVQVKAEIYQLNTDGTTNRLSRPTVTTKSGNEAMIRVVENGSGLKYFGPGADEFEQEDLGNLGVRFSVTPQVIGEYIRVSGVVILTKSIAPKEESFQQKGIPYYSYSVTKMVVPFCHVLPPGVEAVEFKVGEEGGIKMMCRLNAVVVDDRGMTREQRETARGTAMPANTSIQVKRPDSNVNRSVIE